MSMRAGLLNPFVQRTRDSGFRQLFGHQWPCAADNRRYTVSGRVRLFV